MIELNIPGRGLLELEHLVCDLNGTLALDGQLLEGVGRALTDLRDRLEIHLVSADTRGRLELITRQLNIRFARIQAGNESQQKADYVRQLGAERVIAIGQGENDAEMLKCACLGICVLSREGTAIPALLAADLVAPDIYTALEMIEYPLRLVATLRK